MSDSHLFEFRVGCHDGEVEQRNRNEGSLGQIYCQHGVDEIAGNIVKHLNLFVVV